MRVNILLTSAGRRVQLLRLLREDALAVGVKPRVLVAELSPQLSPAACLADAAFRVPPATHPEYAEALLDLCRAEEVSLLTPTIDTELTSIAEARSRFSEAGVLVNISAATVIAVARDKFLTATTLADAGILTPRTAEVADVLAHSDEWEWPVMFKPRGGSSSVGIAIAGSPDELRAAAHDYPTGIVQSLEKGPEFTVNAFYDADGALQAAVPHLRKETRSGEVSKGVTLRHADLESVAERLGSCLPGMFGAVCFQAIETTRGAAVFEINARFGGGFPLAHRAGAPFTRWLIELSLGRTPAYSNDWSPWTSMLRFDDAVFATLTDDDEKAAW